MKIKTEKTNFGNFDWIAELEVTEAQAAILASAGVVQFMQRSPSSAAEKAMAGYEKRPDGFKRSSIPFTDENVETLRENLSSLKIGDVDVPVKVTITRHVYSEANVKLDDERAKYASRKDDLATLAKKVGYTGELGDGTAENAPVEFLRAIRAFTTEQAKKVLAGI